MDTKLIIRVSIEEKNDLNNIASELDMTLSEYVRRKIMGKSLKRKYIEYIRLRIDYFKSKEIFSLRQILNNHWKYMSKGDRKKLLRDLIKLVEEDEVAIDIYQINEKSKPKFIKE